MIMKFVVVGGVVVISIGMMMIGTSTTGHCYKHPSRDIPLYIHGVVLAIFTTTTILLWTPPPPLVDMSHFVLPVVVGKTIPPSHH